MAREHTEDRSRRSSDAVAPRFAERVRAPRTAPQIAPLTTAAAEGLSIAEILRMCYSESTLGLVPHPSLRLISDRTPWQPEPWPEPHARDDALDLYVILHQACLLQAEPGFEPDQPSRSHGTGFEAEPAVHARASATSGSAQRLARSSDFLAPFIGKQASCQV